MGQALLACRCTMEIIYSLQVSLQLQMCLGFPGVSGAKNTLACPGAAGNMGLISGLGRSLGGGNGNLPSIHAR